MKGRTLIVVGAIIVAVLVAGAVWYLTRGPRDSDEDGVADGADAFPNNPDQSTDTDGDGYGDNPDGDQGDAFPSDPLEWADSDDDGTGNNADLYDQGDAAVRIVIQSFWKLDSALCDGDPCDIVFRFSVDVDGADPFEPTCSADSPVYADADTLTEPGASITCGVAEAATAVIVEIRVMDDNGTILDAHPNAGWLYVANPVDLPPSGYYSIGAMFPYDAPPVQIEWRAEIVGL